MKGVNIVGISGNVASDVLFSETGRGDAACSFRIAISEKFKPSVFVGVNAYMGNAEVCEKRGLKKSDYVIVEGELMNRNTRGDTLLEVRCKSIVITPGANKRRETNGYEE